MVTAVFRVGELVPKINWTPWTPSFRYQSDKRHLYDTLILSNLRTLEDFDKLSSENMYKELVWSITEVGKKLMVSRKPKSHDNARNIKLKRLKRKVTIEKTRSGKQSQEYKKVAEEWTQESRRYRAKRMETKRQKREEQQRARLWTKPTLKNFWDYVKLGARPDVKITSVKSGQDPLSFDKETIKEKFVTEFKERFQASISPLDPQPKTRTSQGRYGQELDNEVSIAELEAVIMDLKNCKAIGLDSVPNEIIKLLGQETKQYLLSFVNACMRDREMPAELKKGRVALIYKGEDRRVPRNYRPITVNSVLSKIITRLITIRMTTIVEREGMLQDNQFGFRKKRATEDAILLFNTVLTEAKLRKIDLYLSFVDLEKAYDRVSRPALFKKLLDLGFGGQVYDLIRDMYTGDSLYIQVNGELCRVLYLTQGVKQGCNLSPLFFNLLMIDMSKAIMESKEGCRLGSKVFSGALFADDLGVVSTSRTGLARLLEIIEREGASFNMKISTKKSKIMIMKHSKENTVTPLPMNLDLVLYYKYLGVQLEARPRAQYFEEYESQVLKKAAKYLNVIRTKSRSFPDPAYAAYNLWHRTALPSILYGMQVVDVRKRTWERLEAIHCRLGKFVLNVGQTIQNVAVYLACQMEPMRFIVDRMTKSAVDRLCGSSSELVQEALMVAEGQGNSNHFYKKYAVFLNGVTEAHSFEDFQIASMTNFLTQEITRTEKTSFLFKPLGSFILDKQPYTSLTTEEYTDFINFVFCNKGLGNRKPSSYLQTRNCLACLAEGLEERLSEPHILMQCPRYTEARKHVGMHDAVTDAMQQTAEPMAAYAVFWGKTQNHTLAELRSRISMSNQLVDIYENDVKVILDIMKGTIFYNTYKYIKTVNKIH